MSWRNETEKDFPADASKMKDSVTAGDVLNFSFVFGWVKHASINELLAPRSFFLGFDLGHELVEGLGSLLSFNICDDIDDLETLFTKLGSIWCDVIQLDSETHISNTSVYSTENWDLNCGFGLILLEFNGSFDVRVVNTSGSCVVRFIQV
jgi:hypothetical protein